MLNDAFPTLTVGGPLTRRIHEQTVRLATPAEDRLARQASSFCHGKRQFGRPIMALTAKKSLGPVRHALSQMVVAGTMVVQPPVQIRIPLGTASDGVPPDLSMSPDQPETSTPLF